MSSNVEKIKEKLDIVDVVGSYVKLEKSGANFKAKCPFHNEKTPSFFVSPSRGSFYCFGCNSKGDIFSFVEQFEGLDFMGALKVLASRAGVTLVRENVEAKNERERIFELLDEAALFFEKKLEVEGEVKKYLKDRGLLEKTVSEWRIGFIPDEWRLLRSHFLAKGFTDGEMLRVGLIKKSENPKSSEKYYDTFRGRIMFPIFDTSGRVVAFSGRIFKDEPDTAKYLNSPETELFKKSETLYGLHIAKLPIRKLDYSILVEGQMDLIMSHQAGCSNTVASSGTALTAEHLGRLKRLSNRIIIAFDADIAGFTAADRSASLAMSIGMEVKLAALPRGTDPAELIKKDPKLWKEHLKNAKHIVDFHLDQIMSEGLDGRKIGKSIQAKVLPYVSALESAIEKSHFISKIASQTKIKEEALWDDLKKIKRMGVVDKSGNQDIGSTKSSGVMKKDFLVRRLFGLLFWQVGHVSPSIVVRDVEKKIIDFTGEDEFQSIKDEMLKLKNDLVFEAEIYYVSKSMIESDLPELLLNFEEDFTKQQFTAVMNDLNKAEKIKDHEKATELLKRCQVLSKKMADLSAKKAVK